MIYTLTIHITDHQREPLYGWSCFKCSLAAFDPDRRLFQLAHSGRSFGCFQRTLLYDCIFLTTLIHESCCRPTTFHLRADSERFCFRIVIATVCVTPRLSQSPSHEFFRFWSKLARAFGARFIRFLPFLIFCYRAYKYRVITKNISESTCGKST